MKTPNFVRGERLLQRLRLAGIELQGFREGCLVKVMSNQPSLTQVSDRYFRRGIFIIVNGLHQY